MTRFHLIANGLGAGNIGDDLMFRAFWRHAPSNWVFDVPLFPESARQRMPYPAPHRYFAVNQDGVEESAIPGLLVGTTLVSENEGTDWPLRFLARRLDRFHARGLPVDVAGGGVDQLRRRDSREIFRESFAPIRSWTVRAEQDRDALLDLGVPDSAIVVGADWAWLHEPAIDREWAAGWWRKVKVDPLRPLLVANLVHHANPARMTGKMAIAAALDRLARDGFQIALFANEVRGGEQFDTGAATDVLTMMHERAAIVPNEYYSPDEAIALLSFAHAAISERYHFTIEAVLAGAMPVNVVRGQKMISLCSELGLKPAGRVDDVDPDELVRLVHAPAVDLRDRVAELRERAARNLAFVNSGAAAVVDGADLQARA